MKSRRKYRTPAKVLSVLAATIAVHCMFLQNDLIKTL